MKRIWIVLFCTAIASMAFADITFIAPANNASLTIGTPCQIQWSGPPSEAAQTVTVFMSNLAETEIMLVDNTHTKGDGGFQWEVGRLKNGNIWYVGGQVKMWLESDDGDSGEHTITMVEQPFRLDHPVSGETLTIGTQYHVQWHGQSYFGYQTVTMFLEIPSQNWYQIVDNTHTKTDGGFMWEVGRLKNGTLASPGQYTISLESDEGDYMGPTVTLQAAQWNFPIKDIYKQIRIIRIFPDPPCPMCFKLDLKDIPILYAKIRGTQTVKLFKNNRQVARLGQIGPRQKLPDAARIKLNQKQMATLKQQGKIRFQIRVFSQKGKPLHTQDVLLQISKAQLQKLNKTRLKMK